MRGFIPISTVIQRTKKLKTKHNNSYAIYPLYSNFKESYDFNNLVRSLDAWTMYSSSEINNVNRIFEILDIVNENGNEQQLGYVIGIFNKTIIPCIENQIVLKGKILNQINNNNKQYFKSSLDYINESIECDRLLKNNEIISKRYNLDKIVNNNLANTYNNDFKNCSITESVSAICSLIDTYDIDFKLKLSISMESCLYNILKNFPYIDEKMILENVIDYFISTYNIKDNISFLNEIKSITKKDLFVNQSIINEYTDYLSNLTNKEDNIYSDYDFKYNLSTNNCIPELSGLSQQLDRLSEFTDFINSYVDKAKEIVSKVKLAPTKTFNLLKEAINSLLVINRLQDMKKGVHNSLSLTFYLCITLSSLSIGLIPGALGLISSIIIHKYFQKEYLKSSLSQWKEHRIYVKQRIEDTDDPEKKRKLNLYLEEVNKNIILLEKAYDKERDKTKEELEIEEKMKDTGHEMINNFINKSSNYGLRSTYNHIVNNKKDILSKVNPYGKEVDLDKYGRDNKKEESKPKEQHTQVPRYQGIDPENAGDLAEYERYMMERKAEKHKGRR